MASTMFVADHFQRILTHKRQHPSVWRHSKAPRHHVNISSNKSPHPPTVRGGHIDAVGAQKVQWLFDQRGRLWCGGSEADSGDAVCAEPQPWHTLGASTTNNTTRDHLSSIRKTKRPIHPRRPMLTISSCAAGRPRLDHTRSRTRLQAKPTLQTDPLSPVSTGERLDTMRELQKWAASDKLFINRQLHF